MKIISNILQTQQDCIQMSKEIHRVTKDIESYKIDLNTLFQRFDSFEFNDQKYDDILLKVNVLQPKFEDAFRNYKCMLLGNRDYEFNGENMSMEDVFGSFISYPVGKVGLRSSKIISNNKVIELMNLCEFPKHKKFQLLYRASEDGFSSANFHEKCDGVKNTLTIVKTTNNNIFGDYTGGAWNSSGNYVHDTSSFMFSLINPSNDPFKAKCTNSRYAIYGHPSYGPTFGHGHDFLVSSNSNKNKASVSMFGRTYTHGSHDLILMGSYRFQTTEIEVFEKLD